MSSLRPFANSDGDVLNVYRLRENPTWQRFGIRTAAPASFLSPSQEALNASQGSVCSNERHLSTQRSQKTSTAVETGSCRETNSFSSSPSGRLSSHVDASNMSNASSTACVTVRDGQRQRASEASFSQAHASTQDTESHVFSQRSTLHSSTKRSMLTERAATSSGLFGDCTNARERRADSDVASLFTGACAATSVCSSRASTRTEPEASPASAAPARRVPTSASSSPSTSVSRATETHLSGSAAFVDVEGPLDSLYVPLRRPPPRNCEATRQHFAIFGAESNVQRDSGRRSAAYNITASYPAQVGLQSRFPHEGVGGSGRRTLQSVPSSDGYRTSNSAYGQGC